MQITLTNCQLFNSGEHIKHWLTLTGYQLDNVPIALCLINIKVL